MYPPPITIAARPEAATVDFDWKIRGRQNLKSAGELTRSWEILVSYAVVLGAQI